VIDNGIPFERSGCCLEQQRGLNEDNGKAKLYVVCYYREDPTKFETKIVLKCFVSDMSAIFR
jgi:hypothetical protein